MISLHLFRKVSATNVRYFKTRLPDLGKRIPGKRTLPPAEGTSMWDNDFTMQFWSKWNFWKPYKPPQLPGRLCPLPSGPIACNPARTLAGSLRAWEVLRNEQPIFQATSPQRTAPCYQLKKSYNVAATWSYIYIYMYKKSTRPRCQSTPKTQMLYRIVSNYRIPLQGCSTSYAERIRFCMSNTEYSWDPNVSKNACILITLQFSIHI